MMLVFPSCHAATVAAVETALPLSQKSRDRQITFITGLAPAPRYPPYVSYGVSKTSVKTLLRMLNL
jgi:hypothetical protein